LSLGIIPLTFYHDRFPRHWYQCFLLRFHCSAQASKPVIESFPRPPVTPYVSSSPSVSAGGGVD
jgi:hypothetical protein